VVPVADRAMSESELPCDLCGATDALELSGLRRYTAGQRIHVCTRCGLVYVKRRRPPREVATYWSEQVFGGHYTARIPAMKARQVFVAETIDVALVLRGKRVCDIGTGEGQFLEIIRSPEYGAEAFGTEASAAHSAALARAGLRHFLGTAEELVAGSAATEYRADIVTLMWTLECSASCRNLLDAAFRLLDDGGHIVVATGSRILVPFKKPLHYYLNAEPLDIHPVRFSANTLHGILAVSGFEVVATNRFIDHDVLCVIARKREAGADIPWKGDDPTAVMEFFARWDRESMFYAGWPGPER